ncbi:MAG TPA: hypothetical protein DCZ92_14650, partial [Elusimicrobia bacterium]|nr:hypothetical protein [Elusimicrobiota bacterium]
MNRAQTKNGKGGFISVFARFCPGIAKNRGLAQVLTLLLAVLAPSCSWAAADPRIIGSGSVSESSMRTMFKNSNGYWIFFNVGGVPSWSYSPTGDAGSWRAGPVGEAFSKPIFDGTGFENLGTNPSIWYVEASSIVFVALGNTNSVSAADRPVHLRKGQVNDDGSITWIHSGEINLSPCAAAACSPWTDAMVSIAVDKDGYVWINENASDSGLPGQVDNKTLYAKSNTTWAVGSSSWTAPGTNQKLDNFDCGTNTDGGDNESGNINIVVPHGLGDANNKVWQTGHNATEDVAQLYVENDNTANTTELRSIDYY